MNPNLAKTEIRRVATELLKLQLAIDTNSAVERRSGGETLITWPAGTNGYTLTNNSFGTIYEYRTFLTNRQYTAVLWDGALIQLSYSFEADTMIKHRFGYYPCPIGPIENFDINSSGDVFDSLLFADDLILSEIETSENVGPRLRLRSPLRFDFDIKQQKAGHPASHLHISEGRVRIPVYGPLSIGHFLDFVFRHFYPDIFAARPVIRDWPKKFANRSVSELETRELHFECRQEVQPTRWSSFLRRGRR